jgi:hypothetical protein
MRPALVIFGKTSIPFAVAPIALAPGDVEYNDCSAAFASWSSDAAPA